MSSPIDSSQIYVQADLAGAGNTINSQADQMRDELVALKNKLAPLQDAWNQSQAATYYQGLQTEWDIAFDGLCGPDGVLGRIAHTLNVNWGNYTDAEWSNIQTWKHN